MPRILVFGKNGQLASALAVAAVSAEYQLAFFGHSEFNLIEQVNGIRDFIGNYDGIDCVINASAYTNVDKAEQADWQAAVKLNTLAVSQMAQACQKKNIPFIHISTESVFDGHKNEAYLPTDKTCPANFYGLTKYLGEDFTHRTGGRNIILRTSWVFANTGHNFVKAILNAASKNKTIQVVDDQIGLPTYAPVLANAVLAVANKMIAEPDAQLDFIYHIAGGGPQIDRSKFAELIIQMTGLSTKVEPISSERFAAPAPRPKNAVLDTESFTSTFDLELPNWQLGLKHMLSRIGQTHE